MMAVYRVARVMTTPSSPVARIDAVDAEGHELRLEVPVTLAEQAAFARVLVLQWSLHDLPAILVEAPPQVAPPTTTPVTREVTGRSVDEAFMTLMARGRQVTPETRVVGPEQHNETPASTAGARDITDEFNTLLGAPRRKG